MLPLLKQLCSHKQSKTNLLYYFHMHQSTSSIHQRQNGIKQNLCDYTCSFNFKARLKLERIEQANQSTIVLSCDIAPTPGQGNLDLLLSRSSQLVANRSIRLASTCTVKPSQEDVHTIVVAIICMPP